VAGCTVRHTVTVAGCTVRQGVVTVGHVVGPGGTLLVIARARDVDSEAGDGPPWALTRAEVDAFLATGLQADPIEELRDEGPPATHRWRAQLSRR
jgi:hypothetical protein